MKKEKSAEIALDVEVAVKNLQRALAEINNANACLDHAILCMEQTEKEECE